MERAKETSQMTFEQRQGILKNILQSPQTLYPINSGSKKSIMLAGQMQAGALLTTYSQEKNVSQIAEDFSHTAVTTLAGIETPLRSIPMDEKAIHTECIKLALMWKQFIQNNPKLKEQIQTLLQPDFISLQYGITPEKAEITSSNFTLLISNSSV